MRHPGRGTGQHPPAVPQLVRQGHRPRPGDRPSHCHRLQRRHPGVVDRRRRDDRERAHADSRRREGRPGRRGRRGRAAMSQSSSAAKTGRAAGLPPTPREGSHPRILVVDDEPSMRDMLRIVLRRDGYEVTIAENGRQAIEKLKTEPFDLLLSDIRMPDITGVEVLRAAKDLNPDVVAFMMTAFASTDTAVEAMRLGAVDYFTKPFSMDELRLKIRQHLETHRLKQENVLLKRALNTQHEFSNIIGRSEAMVDVFKVVE